MKLAINATSLLSLHTGVGQYTYQLAKELINLADIDADFFYSLFWSKQLHDTPSRHTTTLLSNIRSHIPFSYELRRYIQKRKFTTHTRRHCFDIYHEPSYLLMPFNGPSILTIHDLSWIAYPETHPVERVRALDKYFEASLASATHVITDSNFVKQEIIKQFNTQESRIHTIPLGVEAIFHPRIENQTRDILENYGLKHNSYILAVGTLEPRKNLSAVFAAYRQLPAPIRTRYPLVLAGMKGWRLDEIDKQLAPLLQCGEIRLLGYIPRTELAVVTAGAITLIYPSLYEGFGLPPLEAMACGVPPIVSNVSSLPEVVTSGGIKISPTDTDALNKAIRQLIEDDALRSRLGQQALQRSQELTWQRCAAMTYQLYQRAIAEY